MEMILQFWDESTKQYVEVSADNPLPISVNLAEKLEDVQPIADPSSATAQDVANAFNALLSALKG